MPIMWRGGPLPGQWVKAGAGVNRLHVGPGRQHETLTRGEMVAAQQFEPDRRVERFAPQSTPGVHGRLHFRCGGGVLGLPRHAGCQGAVASPRPGRLTRVADRRSANWTSPTCALALRPGGLPRTTGLAGLWHAKAGRNLTTGSRPRAGRCSDRNRYLCLCVLPGS